MPALFRLPKPVAVSGSNSYPGSKLYFYTTGTNTPEDVYTDADLQVAHSVPVTADADGVFAPIWLDPEVTYKMTWNTASNALIYTVDPISETQTASDIGRILYPRTAAEITAGVTPTNYAYPPGDVRRYGAVGDGITNDAPAIQSAINAANVGTSPTSGNARVHVPAGYYLLSSPIEMPDYMEIVGDGPFSTIFTGSISSASYFRGQYGETPSIGQRPVGLRLRGFSIQCSSIQSGSIGINFRNAQYSIIDDVLIKNVDIGFTTDQIAQYNNYINVVVQVANSGAYLESVGGGNKLDGCDIAGNVVALDLNGGVYDVIGGTYEALQTTTDYCIHVGRSGGTTTVIKGNGLYVEGTDASIVSIQFENSVTQSYVRMDRHSTLGTVVNNAGDNVLIEIPGQGYYTPVYKAQRIEFAATIDGSPQSSLRSNGGNTLEVRNSANSDYADIYARNMSVNGAPAGVSGWVTFGNATQSTVGAAGGASALPATPTGYLRFYVGTTEYVIPYYARV